MAVPKKQKLKAIAWTNHAELATCARVHRKQTLRDALHQGRTVVGMVTDRFAGASDAASLSSETERSTSTTGAACGNAIAEAVHSGLPVG